MPVAETLVQASLLGDAVDVGPALVLVADDEMRYVAVNQTACSVLGYTREELLALDVTAVATNPDAPAEYASLMAEGHRHGVAELRAKDGTLHTMRYRAGETTVAGMRFYVAILFPEREA
jgi:PAS domain S-box-containing protein